MHHVDWRLQGEFGLVFHAEAILTKDNNIRVIGGRYDFPREGRAGAWPDNLTWRK